jgi:hypothetical protein
MFTIDMPNLPPQYTPIVLTQAAVAETSLADATLQPDFLFNVCAELPSAGGAITAMNTIDPAGMLVAKIGNDEGRYIDPAKAVVKASLLEGTLNGKLNLKKTRYGREYYIYESKAGYEGKDKAVFIVEFEGKRYKEVVNVFVSKVIDERSPKCTESDTIWIYTKPATGSSGYILNTISVSYQPNPAFERDSPRSAASPSILR